MGKGACFAWGLSSVPPCPLASPASPWAPWLTGPPGQEAGPGRRLQLRAAASRWNFLTNTLTGGRQLPERGRRRGSVSLGSAGAGCLGDNSGEGRGTVHLACGRFPPARGEGNPEVSSQKPRRRGARCLDFPAPQLRPLQSAQ